MLRENSQKVIVIMKILTVSSLLAVAALLAAPLTQAGVDVAQASSKKARLSNKPVQTLTGSAIPARVTTKRYPSTVGGSPLLVLGGSDFSRSGATSVTGMLKNVPGVFIRSGRR
jgi:outer membrane receptor for Fe3+-dicitrate